MRRFARICPFVVAISFALYAQSTVPAKWIGTWKLNISKSAFGMILVPGIPADFKILNQTLKIEQATNGIGISGDTVFYAGGESQTDHDDNTLRLDGGSVSLSFRRIDDSAFEIVSAVNDPNANVGEVSRYAFSADGSELTATKIQTERAPVPSGADKSKSAVIRTSKSILVYDKVAEHE